MKRFFLPLLLSFFTATSPLFADVFVYQGIRYNSTTSTDPDLVCGNTPICYVLGFADNNSTVLDIPADWVFDEQGNAYWPIVIESNAFKNSNLRTILSLGTVQKIRYSAFAGTAITQVASITVMKIESDAFYNCTQLTTAEFIACTEIGYDAFCNCTSLHSTLFPLVGKIGSGAFANDVNLSTFLLSVTVNEIGVNAFSNCTNLDVIVDAAVAMLYTIPNGCFQGCRNLRSFHIPSCVTQIGINAFKNCSALERISIPDDVTSIGTGAFDGCTNLNTVIINGCCTLGDRVFANCDSIKLVRICLNQISKNFSEIFPQSHVIEEVQIKEGSPAIGRMDTTYSQAYGSGMFTNLTSLRKVIIPEGIVNIGDMAFYGCTSLTEITLPVSLRNIGYQAFGQSGIRSISIPDNVTFVKAGTCIGCPNLDSVSLGNGMTYIPNACFEGCTALHSIHLNENIRTLGNTCFRYCTALEDVTIEGGFSTIANSSVFYGCSALKNLSILLDYEPTAKSHNRIADIFPLNNLEKLTLLEGSRCLGTLQEHQGELWAATKLKRLVLPHSLEYIGNLALGECTALESIYLPEGVTNIGYGAFYGCTNVQKITSLATIPPSISPTPSFAPGYSAMKNISRSVPLYVPSGSINAYMAAPIWQEFFVQDISNKPYDPNEDEPAGISPMPDGSEISLNHGILHIKHTQPTLISIYNPSGQLVLSRFVQELREQLPEGMWIVGVGGSFTKLINKQ